MEWSWRVYVRVAPGLGSGQSSQRVVDLGLGQRQTVLGAHTALGRPRPLQNRVGQVTHLGERCVQLGQCGSVARIPGDHLRIRQQALHTANSDSQSIE